MAEFLQIPLALIARVVKNIKQLYHKADFWARNPAIKMLTRFLR